MPDPPQQTAVASPAPHVVLRALRDASGLTQQGWAAWLGYSVATIRRWETGGAAPTSAGEEALLAHCHQKGLFRMFEQGPLRGFTLTQELLRDLLAEARLGISRQSQTASAPAPSTQQLPSGTVTFLFTDLEGQTTLWETHPEGMRTAMARHDAILRKAVLAHDGHIVKGTGDGLHAVFADAADGLAAALDAQQALLSEAWQLPRTL